MRNLIRSKVLRGLSCAALVLAFGTSVATAQTAAPAKVYKARLATSIPNKPDDLSSAWAIEAFRSRLKERTGGQVELEVFWAGQLYSEVAAIKAMLDGAVEFSSSTSSNASGFTRAYFVLDMPYLFPNVDVLGKTIVAGPFNKRLKEMVTKDGVSSFSVQ